MFIRFLPQIYGNLTGAIQPADTKEKISATTPPRAKNMMSIYRSIFSLPRSWIPRFFSRFNTTPPKTPIRNHRNSRFDDDYLDKLYRNAVHFVEMANSIERNNHITPFKDAEIIVLRFRARQTLKLIQQALSSKPNYINIYNSKLTLDAVNALLDQVETCEAQPGIERAYFRAVVYTSQTRDRIIAHDKLVEAYFR